MMFFVSMRSRGDLAMDAISIAALIVGALGAFDVSTVSVLKRILKNRRVLRDLAPPQKAFAFQSH
jgi:hypothetical protein